MIVACTSCKARFRVADEKVGPRGSRARCIRCGTVFVIEPPPPPASEAGAEAPAVAPPAPQVPEPQVPPSAPAEPPPPARVPTGWTDAFAAAASADPSRDALGAAADRAPARVPRDDPFIRATSPAPEPAWTPAEKVEDPFAGFRGSAATNLADLERTGVREMKA